MAIKETELQAHLRWETTQTDPDKKLFRTVEWSMHRLEDLADHRHEYFAAFDGVQTKEDLDSVAEVFKAHPEWVDAARRSAECLSHLTRAARLADARGPRTAALLDQWVAILSERYPKAAVLAQVARHQ